ncbi:MAG: GGDEF domain-containing protein [Planctomycetaceae bacterium]|nr:GGDEF domain-containing protein [Planctomycetaceae bacterium]
MWPLIYLSFLNAGIGFAVALVIYRRHRYVLVQVSRGYDLTRLSPYSRVRSLLRRWGWRVHPEKVCRRLGAPPAIIVPASERVAECSTERTATLGLLDNLQASEQAPSSAELSEPAPPAIIATLSSVETSATTARELEPREEEHREVRCLDPLEAKYGGETAVQSAEKTQRIKEIATLDPARQSKTAKLSELSSNTPQNSVGTDPTHTERQSYAPESAVPGDFLARAAAIDRMLRAVLEEEATDPEATLREVVSEVNETHQWWTKFEGTIAQTLKKSATAPVPREQLAQVDDDLVAMQACLVDCKNLIDSAIPASHRDQNQVVHLSKSSPNFSRDMYQSMLQASKACHRLRDNLAILTPESPLQFCGAQYSGADSRPPIAYEAALGIQGLEAVLSQWAAQVARGAPNFASVVLFDVDRTAHWNNELGLQSVDRILGICHRQLAESVRSNRGFDRVVRVCGQQFLVFLGATSAAQAKFAADRLRQVFANTTWREAGQAFVMQLSAALMSYDAARTIGTQISNLRAGLPEAKRLGGNTVVELVESGRFQKVSGVPKYPLPARHHDQPLEKWKPKASVTC